MQVDNTVWRMYGYAVFMESYLDLPNLVPLLLVIDYLVAEKCAVKFARKICCCTYWCQLWRLGSNGCKYLHIHTTQQPWPPPPPPTTPSSQPTGPRCGDGSSAGAQIYSTTSLYTASLYIYCIYISLQPPRWPLSDQCVASASSVSWRGGSWSPIVYRPTCVAYIILSAHLRPLIASDDLVTTVVS